MHREWVGPALPEYEQLERLKKHAVGPANQKGSGSSVLKWQIRASTAVATPAAVKVAPVGRRRHSQRLYALVARQPPLLSGSVCRRTARAWAPHRPRSCSALLTKRRSCTTV